MRRRTYLTSLGATVLGGTVLGSTRSSARSRAVSGVETLQFHSSASLLAPGWEPLTDDSLIPVWAEDSASNDDYDGDDDAFVYWESRDIPLVAADGNVVGFGSILVDDEHASSTHDNQSFVCNVLDAKLGGSGTVLWDESHDQYWTLDSCSGFESQAEGRGYDVQPTGDITDDLPGADALVVTSPGYDFWQADVDAVVDFVADGGLLLLFDESDYNDYDNTDNLNELASALDVGFRFNDDQVVDDDSNAGASYRPVTSNFEPSFPFFGDGGGDGNTAPSVSVSVDDASPSVGTSVTFTADATDPDGSVASVEWSFGDGATAAGASVDHSYDAAGDYTATATATDDDGASASAATTVSVGDSGRPDGTVVDVTSVADGDTVDVQLPDGSTESVRVLGVDTPEKAANRDAERPPEWEGIESYDYLASEGAAASTFAKDRLSDETVEIVYDENEGRTDPYGRLLTYIYYDATGDGNRDTLYNRELVATGHARVYGSSLTRHDAFRAVEATARANDTGLWSGSDPDATPETRDGAVDELFVPQAAAVTSTAGALDASRAPVLAADSAGNSGSVSGDLPLVGVDADASVALVGGLLVDETYERAEGYPVDTSGYGNFAFLTNLVDSLGRGSGDLIVDGGHGQFGSDAALSSEDAAYYQHYLEGQDVGFEQVNDLASADLSTARAVLVTTPESALNSAETAALADHVAGGGAVVLMGASNADSAGRSNLNDLASALGSDLRLDDGAVTDGSRNLNGDASVPTTSSFSSSFDLFGPHS